MRASFVKPKYDFMKNILGKYRKEKNHKKHAVHDKSMTPIESCEQCSNISDNSDCGNSNNGNKKLVFFQESESCGTCPEAGSIKGSDGENDRKVKHQEKLEKLFSYRRSEQFWKQNTFVGVFNHISHDWYEKKSLLIFGQNL